MTGIASMSATAKVRKGNTPQREPNDYYRTPAAATEALMAVELFPRNVWEPACGDGAISEVLLSKGHEVISTDLVARGYGEAGQDFLFARNLLAPAIVTNPPFKLADEFVLHSLRLGARKIAMFMRLGWLEGSARRSALWQPHPPARVWVFSRRQTLWRGDDLNPKTTGGAIAFAWFVWERGHGGPPRLGWLP